MRGRILDLAPKAAVELGMKMHGTAPVYIEIARREPPSATMGWAEFDWRSTAATARHGVPWRNLTFAIINSHLSEIGCRQSLYG
ncbi:MAG: hypothetical protein ACREEL_06905 [Stellaceae bacterium]